MIWKVVKTKKDYNVAIKRATKIFDAKEGSEADELDLLIALINDYEDKHIYAPELSAE